MSSSDLPEGLQEMSKYEDAIDRDELENTYDELFEEMKETSMERRTLLKAFAGGGGLATLNALFAQKKFMGDDLESGLKAIGTASDVPFGVQKVDDPPYKVDDEMYERFDATQMDFRQEDPFGANAGNLGPPDTSHADMNYLIDNALACAGSQTQGNAPPIRMENSGESRALIALSQAVPTPGWGVHVNRMGMDHDEALGVKGHPLAKREPDVTDPDNLRKKLNSAARLAGVADLGVAKRDDRWIYAKSEWGAEIKIGDYDEFHTVGEGEDAEYHFPDKLDTVIPIAVEMPRRMGRMGYSYGGGVCSDMGYMRQSIALLMLSRWIRLMGYEAIPSGNDMGPSVPTAIDGGLVQYGRHGRSIHPQFGSNIRVSKIYTDMPLEPDSYIQFGATEFCKACKICANECPAGQISTGERTWTYEGPGEGYSKNEGVYKWYCNSAHCMRFWGENGTNDSQCMNVCPFTQGRSKVHDFIRYLAGGPADGTLSDMSEAFGYESYLSPGVWDEPGMSYLPYGISQDPELGTL
ncbi:MAG TPA: reductive dehalogenase [Natrialbaceae archaeon]|nr:reductive dehalogenase [Natrialbaceae archaeon]